MLASELRARCERFAVEILITSAPLLESLASRDAGLRLRRSSTGLAQNYAAATIARSHADFRSKLRVALEEADETQRWLRMIRDSGLSSDPRLVPLLKEAGELVAIFSKSCATAERRK